MAWNEPGGNGNNNDPWGGGNRGGGNRGGGNQGPPDLDEALRKLQEKMNSIFGGGKGSKPSGSGGSGGSAGTTSLVLIFVLIITGAWWVYKSVYVVNESDRVVVLRLGKYHETVQPGLHFSPYLIDTRYPVNVTRVESIDHSALMLTEDTNIVDVALKVQYIIADPKSYVLQVQDPETSLANATESSLRHAVGTSEMDAVITRGREILRADVRERLQQYMDDYGTGLLISEVNISQTAPPAAVKSAFDDVNKAGEDSTRFVNEAEAYANGIVPEARGKAQRLLEEANAYREEVIARSEGQANRFNQLLTEYSKAPEVTRERMYIDAIETIMSQSSKIMMDVEGGNNIMYLPLDKIAGAAATGRSMSNAPSSTAGMDDAAVDEITEEVMQRLRNRQTTTTTSREAR